jgi:hypothetical protein
MRKGIIDRQVQSKNRISFNIKAEKDRLGSLLASKAPLTKFLLEDKKAKDDF